MQMRFIVEQEVEEEWLVKFSFRPYWQQDGEELRHLETGGAPGYPGTGAFELRSKTKFTFGDAIFLHRVYALQLERYFTTKQWLVDPETGGQFRYERTTFVPLPETDGQTLYQWYKQAYQHGDVALGDGTFIRVTSAYLYRAFPLPSDETPEWNLERVIEGWYTSVSGEKTRVRANLPKRHINLATLWTDARHPLNIWQVSYVLV